MSYWLLMNTITLQQPIKLYLSDYDYLEWWRRGEPPPIIDMILESMCLLSFETNVSHLCITPQA